VDFARIAIAGARCARIAECLAHAVRVAAMSASPDGRKTTEVKRELNRVEALVQETDVVIFANIMQAAEANLGSASKNVATRRSAML
jgi:hypothetical protein